MGELKKGFLASNLLKAKPAGSYSVFLSIFLTLSLSLSTSTAYAIMLPMSTQQLVQESDVVIRGQVNGLESKWAKDNSAIVTHISVSIHDILRGKLDEDLITFQEIIKDEYYKDTIMVESMGGKVDDVAFGMSDTANFQEGEEVILFLKKDKSLVQGEIYMLVGSAQGKYRITADDKAVKEGFGVYLENEEDKAIIDNNIHVDDLIEKIDPEDHAFIHIDRSK